MKILVATGQVWTLSSRARAKFRSRDAWPTHAVEAGIPSYGETALGLFVVAATFKLKSGELFFYQLTKPITYPEIVNYYNLLDRYTWVGGTLPGYGEDWNGGVRASVLGKFTEAQFGAYLNSH